MNETVRSIEGHLSAIRTQHAYAHRCMDGLWHNPSAGAREHCGTVKILDAALSDVHALAGQVAVAAEDAAAVKHVAWAATGLDLDQLGEEDRDGWGQTARDAILGLAGWLDENVPTPHPDPAAPNPATEETASS